MANKQLNIDKLLF